MADRPSHVAVSPFVASTVRFADLPAASLKVLLLLETMRARGRDVEFAVGDFARWLGTKPLDVRGALDGLLAATAALPINAGRDWHCFRVLHWQDVHVVTGRAAASRVTLSGDWCAAAAASRDVRIPLDEVRDLRTRCGLLLRLRGEAMYHQRAPGYRARTRLRREDLFHYTGYDGNGSPANILNQYVFPGIDDCNANSATLAVGARVSRSPGPQQGFRHLELTYRRAVVDEVVHGAFEAA